MHVLVNQLDVLAQRMPDQLAVATEGCTDWYTATTTCILLEGARTVSVTALQILLSTLYSRQVVSHLGWADTAARAISLIPATRCSQRKRPGILHRLRQLVLQLLDIAPLLDARRRTPALLPRHRRCRGSRRSGRGSSARSKCVHRQMACNSVVVAQRLVQYWPARSRIKAGQQLAVTMLSFSGSAGRGTIEQPLLFVAGAVVAAYSVLLLAAAPTSRVCSLGGSSLSTRLEQQADSRSKVTICP